MFLIKPVKLEEGKLKVTDSVDCLDKGDAQVACLETPRGIVYVGASRFQSLQDLLRVVDAVNHKYSEQVKTFD